MPAVLFLGPDTDLIEKIQKELKKKMPKAEFFEATSVDEFNSLVDKRGEVFSLVMVDSSFYIKLKECIVENSAVIKYSPKDGVYDTTSLNTFLKQRRTGDVLRITNPGGQKNNPS